VNIDRDLASAPTIDETRLAEYVAALKDVKKKHKLAGEIDLSTLLRLPDVIRTASDDVDQESGKALLGIVATAAESLVAMRRAEGAQLARFLTERVQAVENRLARAESRAPIRLKEHHERVKRTVGELMGAAALDPQRVAQEIAILADKLDIAEELDRFRSHLAAFRETVRSTTGEPVGKRLGFILQEMLREANTIGSKANDAAILDDVIAIKEELERIREQVENLE
jgi:uncharacterized protein (TIGR00255 family)